MSLLVNMDISLKIYITDNKVKACLPLGYAHIYDKMKALDLITPTSTPDEMILEPVLTKNIIIDGTNIYLDSRWPKDICRRGGLEKYNFIGLQLDLFNLQEQIERENVGCEFYLNGERVYQAWQKIERKGKDVKEYIKGIKKRGIKQLEKKTCPRDAKKTRPTGRVPLCCMCNVYKKLVLNA